MPVKCGYNLVITKDVKFTCLHHRVTSINSLIMHFLRSVQPFKQELVHSAITLSSCTCL